MSRLYSTYTRYRVTIGNGKPIKNIVDIFLFCKKKLQLQPRYAKKGTLRPDPTNVPSVSGVHIRPDTTASVDPPHHLETRRRSWKRIVQKWMIPAAESNTQGRERVKSRRSKESRARHGASVALNTGEKPRAASLSGTSIHPNSCSPPICEPAAPYSSSSRTRGAH